MQEIAIVWFKRHLRIADHNAAKQAKDIVYVIHKSQQAQQQKEKILGKHVKRKKQ